MKSFEEIMQMPYVAGAIAGATARTCTAPIDRTKTLMQVTNCNSALQTVKKAVTSDGLRSLWWGNGPNVARVIITNGLRFGIFEHLKKHNPWLAAVAAGTVQNIVTYPLQVLQTRASAGIPNRHLIQTEGIGALWRGFGITLCSGVPYVTIMLGSRDYMNTHYAHNWIWNGVIASVLAQTVTYPGDTIRRRMHVDIQRKLTTMQCIKNLWNESSMGRAFFRGCLINNIRVLPANMLQFYIYDYLRCYNNKN